MREMIFSDHRPNWGHGATGGDVLENVPMAKKLQRDQSDKLINAAARLIRDQGYENTTIRDIADTVGMLPGSLYYHFDSKAELLREINRRGMAELVQGVNEAIKGLVDPWERLRAACRTHVQLILEGDEHVGVAVFALPHTDLEVLSQLTASRDAYEDIYRQLVAELPLSMGLDRRLFRLSLLGSLNYTEVWSDQVGLSAQAIGDAVAGTFQFCIQNRPDTIQPLNPAQLQVLDTLADKDVAEASGAKDRRRAKILAAAAHLFATRGYKGTSMRDIAVEADLVAGSLYYHFKSKTELFIAIVDEATQRRSESVTAILNDINDPWAKLELACAVQLSFKLNKNDFVAVINQPAPVEEKEIFDRIIKMRDEVEVELKMLVDDLEFPPELDRELYLYVLLGVINTVHVWYRPHRLTPAEIAQGVIRMLRPQV